MRILQVIHDFIPEVRAGSELYTMYLSSELQQQGHTVLLFYPTWGLKKPVRKQIGQIDCFTFPTNSTPLGIFADFDQRADEIFIKILHEFKPDVVHIQHLLYLSLRIVEIAKQFGAKVIYTLHDYWLLCPRITLLAYDSHICSSVNHLKCVECCKRIVPLNSLKQFHGDSPDGNRWKQRFDSNIKAFRYLRNSRSAFVYDNIFRNTDLFIAPSKFLREIFIENGLAPEKVIFLPNGNDGKGFHRIQRSASKELRFGFIGTIAHHKGIGILIEAFNEISHASLSIYGRISDQDAHFRRMIANPKIRFMGEVGEDEKITIFENIDVLIVPSLWYENAPVTIQEAYQSGIPVIASNLGGMAEYVLDNQTGLLFTPGDAVDLAKKIRTLIANPALYHRLAAHIPKVVGISEHTANIVGLYKNILADQLGIKRQSFRSEGERRQADIPIRLAKYAGKIMFLISSSIVAFRDAWKGAMRRGSDVAVSYGKIETPRDAQGKTIKIRFADQVELLAFNCVIADDRTLELSYTWKLIGAVSHKELVFVHLCSGERIVFQQDHLFFNGQYPLRKWRTGELMEENYRVEIPGSVGTLDELKIKIGIHNLDSGERMKVTSGDGFHLDDIGTRVEIGSLRLPDAVSSPAGLPITASVILLTLNAGDGFEMTLRRVFAQQTSHRFEVIAIDSGSEDKTLQLCAEYGVRVIKIRREEFNHGLTRNLGIYNAKGKYAVMLVQDAVPVDEHWLENLLRNFSDEQVAGVFSRQVPRENADVLTRRSLNSWLTARDFHNVSFIEDREAYTRLSPMDKYLFCAFDDVSSAIRKSVWEQYPFPSTDFAEDLYFSKNILEAGYKIVYEPTSAVMHSHNRSSIYEYQRTYLCHRKLYDLFQLRTVPRIRYVITNTVRNILADVPYLLKNETNPGKILKMLFRIPVLSFLTVVAQYQGARDEKAGRQLETGVKGGTVPVS